MQKKKGKSYRINQIKKGEKTIEVKFVNNEFPKADLQFTIIEGGKPPDKKTGKPAVKGKPRRWHLRDGETYTLPMHVVEHINSLVVEESEYEVDEHTGQGRTIRTYKRNRFTCIPVNMGDFTRPESTGSAKPPPEDES